MTPRHFIMAATFVIGLALWLGFARAMRKRSLAELEEEADRMSSEENAG